MRNTLRTLLPVKTKPTSRKARKATRSLRFQKLDARQLLAADLMNVDNPVDVNADGSVTPGDALAVINDLSARINGAAQGESAAEIKVYPDANGDSEVSPADILMVLNHLAQGEDIPMIPTVTVDGSTESVNEGDSMTLTFARTGATTSELTVPVTVTGQADLDDVTINTTENISLSEVGDSLEGTVTFPAGASEVVVSITAVADLLTESGSEDFSVSISEGSGFDLDSFSSTETVVIVDSSTGSDSMSPVSGDAMQSFFGTSLAGFSGSSLALTLSESDADIAVDAQSDGTVLVRVFDFDGTVLAQEVLNVAPQNVTLTVSGSNNFLSMTGLIIENDMKLHLTGNDNVIVLDSTRVKDDLLIDSGSGDSQVYLQNYSRIDDLLQVDFGGGDDVVYLDQTYVGGHIIAKLGGGDDVFDMTRSTVKENLKVYGESGNDDLRLERSQVRNDLFFYGGNGNDNLFANRSYVSDDAIVDLGNGNDEVFVFGSVVKNRTMLDGESGTDTLFANTEDFITDDLDVDSVERRLAATDPGEPFGFLSA
ncbi:dockerin type I domain-containing protein [Planctomycetes bacterium K23_9]